MKIQIAAVIALVKADANLFLKEISDAQEAGIDLNMQPVIGIFS